MKRLFLTERILLQELCREDAAELFAAIDADRAYLDRWLPFVRLTREEADSASYIRSVMEARPYEYVFTLREEGRFIGLIGFKSTDRTLRRTEIGYWLREAAQGRGIVTRAVELLCRFAAEELGMRRVEIKCAPGNLPSNRIPQRLGFRLERVETHSELLSDGRWHDANVYVKEL